jgi:hypothetical protein
MTRLVSLAAFDSENQTDLAAPLLSSKGIKGQLTADAFGSTNPVLGVANRALR